MTHVPGDLCFLSLPFPISKCSSVEAFQLSLLKLRWKFLARGDQGENWMYLWFAYSYRALLNLLFLEVTNFTKYRQFIFKTRFHK